MESEETSKGTTCCNYSGYRQLVAGGQEGHQERNEIDLVDGIESLVRGLPDHPETMITGLEEQKYSRQAPQNSDHVVSKLVHHLFRIFRGISWRIRKLSKRCRYLVREAMRRISSALTRTYLWHKCPQWGKDVFIVHLRANVISSIDTKISRGCQRSPEETQSDRP